MRLSPLLAVVATLALLGGCGGSSSDETGTDSSPRGGVPTAPAGASARACPGAGSGAGSGSGSGSGIIGLKVTAASCAEARRVASGWRRAKECDKFGASSRSGCSLLSYRCLASATGRGWSVSCAKPGRSIAFTVSRG